MTQTAASPAAPGIASAKPLKESNVGIDYVILSRNDEAGRIVYVHERNVAARDATAAIEKYAAANDNKPGTFIAIAASKWKPVKVTPQTVTTLKLEDAK